MKVISTSLSFRKAEIRSILLKMVPPIFMKMSFLNSHENKKHYIPYSTLFLLKNHVKKHS